jgi:squalene synthase HpnC
MPVEHYENFPVASFLLPRHLRQPIEIIYAFARTADDFADEGDLDDDARLALLDGYRQALDRIESNRLDASDASLFHDLAEVIRVHRLPVQLLRDLLDAFSQDVVKKRYADYAELLDYCRRSANPIGRLLVHLNHKDNEQTLAWSDAICSALQLINFWQDVAVDWSKQRVYLPQEDLQRFGVQEEDIAAARSGPPWQALMQFQCQRARQLLNSGRPLTRELPGRMGLELKLVVAGGNAILDKIENVQGDVFRHRPVLTKLDWLMRAPAALLA